MLVLKKYVFILGLIIFAGVIFFLVFPKTSPFGKEPFYIAYVGGWSGASQQESELRVKAINMFLDDINNKGGINGRKIKLSVFDDKTKTEEAMKIASQIAEDKNILLVLGHSRSETALAAGKIYKKRGIPLITTSTSASVTQGNEWCFRIIQDNNFQGYFIANYIVRSLNIKSASIIFEKTEFGTTIAENFEKSAREIGLEIKGKWRFDKKSKELNNQLIKIKSELKMINDPGMIFIAGYPEEGAKIITLLKKERNTNYLFFGQSNFAYKSFIAEFQKYPEENEIPGYFSDNTYTVSPFLADFGNEKAFSFRTEFTKRYKEEPSWGPAFYYDAANLAVEVIKKSNLHQGSNIRRNRREIRDTLSNITNPEEAVRGVTGLIYFHKDRDVIRPLPVGIYKVQKLVPALSQYESVSEQKETTTALENIIKGELILIGENLMSKAKVIYTDIDINEISKLDIKNSTYTIDFYLRFRYEGEFDAANIEFVNSVHPIKLENPITNLTVNNMTVKSYHIRADFKSDFDFHLYPFDSQHLFIKFRHANKTRDKLIYVPDTVSMIKFANKNEDVKPLINPITGWCVKEKRFYQDIITNVSSLGNPKYFGSQNFINYSRFNVDIHIEKKGIGQIMTNFIPICIMMLFLYFIYYIPYQQYFLRVLTITGILPINAFYHIKYVLDLPLEYCTIVEYAILTIYMLLLMAFFISTLIFYLHRQGTHEKKVRLIIRAGKIAHPCIFFTAILCIVFVYYYTL